MHVYIIHNVTQELSLQASRVEQLARENSQLQLQAKQAQETRLLAEAQASIVL